MIPSGVKCAHLAWERSGPLSAQCPVLRAKGEQRWHSLSVLSVGHSQLRGLKLSFRLFKAVMRAVCLNSQDSLWDETLILLFNQKWQCDLCHVVCGDEKLAQVTWLLHCMTCIRTYLLHLQPPPVWPSLGSPAVTQCELTGQTQLCLIFCLLHSFQNYI